MQIRIEKRKDGTVDLLVTRTIRGEGRPIGVKGIERGLLRSVLEQVVDRVARPGKTMLQDELVDNA